MAEPPNDVRLTDTQLGILAALCRPIAAGNSYATPATNQEIADEVFLSVGAVKGHLRTLYRKFGIEDLPHNQKRARLVELAIEGGYVESTPAPSSRADVPLGSVEAVREAERAAAAARPRKEKRSIGPYVTIVILILVIIGASLAVSGIFNQGSLAPTPPSPAAFRTEVASYCKLALEGAPSTAGQGRAERARGYLEVIETMRGRLQSLVDPTVPSIALERFSTGLTTAANYTSDVAQGPPAPGSAAEAKYVSELTFAAGQVQAGAVGYKLGHDCLEIGDLVARSAENAAAP
ncbi:MAG: response regulator transcription factor [Solirubrobacterales bacterium]